MLSHTLFFCILLSGIIYSDCVNKYCNPNVCAKNHTLCKFPTPGPASHCLDYELTIKSDKDKLLVLDKINARRDKVAAGEIRSLPPAEDMFKMEWNEDLAESAQRWADQCVSNRGVEELEDDCRDLENMKVGQNVATVYGEAPGLTPTALVDVWYIQLLNVNASLLSRYRPSNEVGSSTYNYFTQLVWASSYQVGCGGVKFKEHFEDPDEKKYRVVYRLVCNFAPRGNQLDQAVYMAGPAGTKCTYGKSETHKALCNTKAINSHVNDNTNIDDEESEEVETSTDVLNVDETSVTNNPTTVLSTDEFTTSDLYEEDNTTFDFFSHLYELTKDYFTTTAITQTSKCKNDLAVDKIVEIVKNKLSDDPTWQQFFTTKTPTSIGIKDEKVAAFLNKIYKKATSFSTVVTTSADFVNSTLLVNLVEAVIFRSTDGIKEKEAPEIEMGQYVNPVKVQAVSAVTPHDEFSGHYFFPEYDGDETIKQTTETDYDISYGSSPVPDVVLEIEEIRRNRPTRDFLDEILETESVVDSTTTMTSLSSDDIKLLHTSGYSNMRIFLKDIAETTSESSNPMIMLNYTNQFKRKKRKNKNGKRRHSNVFKYKGDFLNNQSSINHYSEFLGQIVSDLEHRKIGKRQYLPQNKCMALLPVAPMYALSVFSCFSSGKL